MSQLRRSEKPHHNSSGVDQDALSVVERYCPAKSGGRLVNALKVEEAREDLFEMCWLRSADVVVKRLSTSQAESAALSETRKPRRCGRRSVAVVERRDPQLSLLVRYDCKKPNMSSGLTDAMS